MNTIMQQWVETKETIIAESGRVFTCLHEAMQIIEKTTGQKTLQPVTFGDKEGTKVVLSFYIIGSYVKLYAGQSTGQYSENLSVDRHWYGTLKEYKELGNILKGINTGTVISSWENQQE